MDQKHRDKETIEKLPVYMTTATPITANVDNKDTEQINQRIKIIKFQCTIELPRGRVHANSGSDRQNKKSIDIRHTVRLHGNLSHRTRQNRKSERKIKRETPRESRKIENEQKNDARLGNNAPHIQSSIGHATKRAKFTDNGEDGFNSGVGGNLTRKSGESREGYDRRIMPMTIRNIFDTANRMIQFTLKRQEYTSLNFVQTDNNTGIPSDALVVTRNKLGKQTNIRQIGRNRVGDRLPQRTNNKRKYSRYCDNVCYNKDKHRTSRTTSKRRKTYSSTGDRT